MLVKMHLKHIFQRYVYNTIVRIVLCCVVPTHSIVNSLSLSLLLSLSCCLSIYLSLYYEQAFGSIVDPSDEKKAPEYHIADNINTYRPHMEINKPVQVCIP